MTDDPHSGTVDVEAELKFAATIADVARGLAQSMPPPRGAPYFCLDVDASYDLRVLDVLCERLDLGVVLRGLNSRHDECNEGADVECEDGA